MTRVFNPMAVCTSWPWHCRYVLNAKCLCSVPLALPFFFFCLFFVCLFVFFLIYASLKHTCPLSTAQARTHIRTHAHAHTYAHTGPRSLALSLSLLFMPGQPWVQDGTVLCRLANKLIPGSITSFAERPEKQFLKMQNINRFLEACQKKFRMKENELFTADELYYASNFPKVVETLSQLSKTPPVGLAGFGYVPLCLMMLCFRAQALSLQQTV